MERGSSSGSVLPTHLRAMRRSWLYLLIVALSVFAIVEGARSLPKMARARLPGVSFNFRAEIIPPLREDAAQAGFAAGDKILAVDGRPIRDGFDVPSSIEGKPVGSPVVVRVATASGEREATLGVTTVKLGLPVLGFVVATIFIVFGLLVFWFHPGRREVWAFLASCVAYGATVALLIGNPRTTQSQLDSRIGLGCAALVGPMFVALFSVFPRPLPLIVRRPYLVKALLGVVLAFGLVIALSIPRPITQHLRQAATLINLVCVVGCVLIVVWRTRRAASREDVARMRALVTASLIAFLPIAVHAVLVSFHWYTPANTLSELVVRAATLMFPILVGYAIVRRDMFEVERNVARAAATSVSVGMIALAFAGIALLVPRLLAPTGMLGTPTAGALAALIAMALLWPIKTRLQDTLVRSLRDRCNDGALGEVEDALGELAAAPKDAARCGRFERRLEEALELSDAALLVRDNTGWLRPSTGEHVEPRIWGELVELQRDDAVIGAFGVGRAGADGPLTPAVARVLEALAVEAARVLAQSDQAEQIGTYRIDRFLAAGGMGNVYLATKLGAAGFAKQVAIKQLLPEIARDSDSIQRFLKEARLVARLSHPGIVQTFELGENERGYYIAMEYIDGIDAASLARRLRKKRKRLSIPIACQIVTQVCLALEHAHKAVGEDGEPLHLVHHDVSPHNVMIDVEGNVRLADFGVAHVRHDKPAGELVGKIGYMAPEQLRRQPLDHRVDVFAAGIVLYELVTGQHPFAADSDFLTLHAIEVGRFLPPDTLRDECSPRLALVIEQALATDPARRFASAAAFAEAIQKVHPLDSRNATELGALVRSVRTEISLPASQAIPTRTQAPTVS